jgi:hypothetical protein
MQCMSRRYGEVGCGLTLRVARRGDNYDRKKMKSGFHLDPKFLTPGLGRPFIIVLRALVAECDPKSNPPNPRYEA